LFYTITKQTKTNKVHIYSKGLSGPEQNQNSLSGLQ